MSIGAPGGRDITEPTGEAMPSFVSSRAREDRRLIAILGEWILPPYTLVRRLEKPPYEPSLGFSLPRPKPCWFGRSARGMKMNDRSVAGKM